MISYLAHALVERAVTPPDSEPGGEHRLHMWACAVVFINFIILLPVLYFMSYTLMLVIPTLAMVEDENPPAYQALLQTDEAPALAALDSKPFGQPVASSAVTSSLRQTLRHLRAQGGGSRALFQGLPCKLFLDLGTSLIAGLISSVFSGRHRFASAAVVLLPGLLLVQYRTAWVHIVMTRPSPRYFWNRLPPFGRAFRAALWPMVLLWAAETLTTALPVIVAVHSSSIRTEDGNFDESLTWKAPAFSIAILLGRLFLVLPADVVLTRVLASLLPADEHTIVPFDRSFQGRLEPIPVAERKWATMADAWSTFSNAAWRRLAFLYVKILAASAVTLGLVMLFLLPQAILFQTLTKPEN